MKAPTIVILAEGKETQAQLKRLVHEQGFDACAANGVQDFREIIENQNHKLAIVCTANGNALSDLEAINKIRGISPALPIILIANNSSEALAIAAIKAGVSDYFKSPYSQEALLSSINRHIPIYASSPESSDPDATYLDSHATMVCACAQMKTLKAYLLKIAVSDTTVLITGESGTGKELAAALIHRYSRRRQKPFVCVNCAALPENLVESELFGYEKGAFTGATVPKAGKFSQASSGTLFLDEIGDMSLFAQAKVLRSIERKQIDPLGARMPLSLDLRVIAATNQDPEDLIAEGRFRQDLFYRLNVARVHLPPLRERRDDIPALVSHGIRMLNQRHERKIKQLTDDAMETLLQYDWPGNVRELMNLLEASYVNLPNEQIDCADLPEQFKHRIKQANTLPSEERSRIVAALLEAKWNKTAAARKLNWSRMTLYRKMRSYNIVENRQRISY